MRRYGDLFMHVVSFENLFLAFCKALRGKKGNPRAAHFARQQEAELLALQEELRGHTYRPGPYRSFVVTDKKPRLISAAPFRDRVVHHALCNIVEPLFEPSFIFDSYANRVGKGSHRAVYRCSHFARVNRYVLTCDIKKYFPSIDHEVLKGLLRRRIKDPGVLWLADVIIDGSNEQEHVLDWFAGDDLLTPLRRRKGLPIGNQTSQFFANVYLDPLDHFVKEQLRVRWYIRYVDDFLLFAPTKPELWEAGKAICGFLETLRLKLHPRKFHVFPVSAGIPFLGYRVFPTHRLIAADNARRCRRRLRRLQRAYRLGRVSLCTVNASVNGWLGHALHADSYGLRKDLLGGLVLRGPGEPGKPGRHARGGGEAAGG